MRTFLLGGCSGATDDLVGPRRRTPPPQAPSAPPTSTPADEPKKAAPTASPLLAPSRIDPSDHRIHQRDKPEDSERFLTEESGKQHAGAHCEARRPPRRAFAAAEPERVFGSPVYSRGARYRASGGEAAAWLPLIALATGVRLGEICQLDVTDLVEDPQHGYLLRITDDPSGQTVKTATSRRGILLHPQLCDAALLDYWRSTA